MTARSPGHRLVVIVAALLTIAPVPPPRSVPLVSAGRTTTWPADVPLRLLHTLTLGQGDTLRIQAGAHIETARGVGIRVGRGGVLFIEGTEAQPVVFDCSGQRWTGCWDGLTVHGSAPINHGSPGSPDGGCLQALEDLRVYGGCDVRANSGEVRFAVIRNAARGLRLLGVGSGTVVDHVAVIGSLGDGATLRGGTVAVRHLYVAHARDTGLRYDGGWAGRAQYVLVAQDSAHSAAVVGSGAPAASTSIPRLFNVTVWNPPAGGATGESPGLWLGQGATGELRNWLFLQSAVALDIDDRATCEALRTGALTFGAMLFATTGSAGDPDPDPEGCPASADGSDAEQTLIRTSPDMRLVSDAGSIAHLSPAPLDAAGDFRPRPGTSVAGAGDGPYADGFFEATDYVGAVAPDTGVAPWYAGWSTATFERGTTIVEESRPATSRLAPASTGLPPDALPNEPEGATVSITETFDGSKEFADQPGGHWDYGEGWTSSRNISVVDGALRFTYPRGFAGGSAPGIASLDGARLSFSTYYLAIRARWSVPWTDHITGTNKIVYWGEAGAAKENHATSQFFLNRRGRYIDVALQWGQGYAAMCNPNDAARSVPDCSVQRRASTRVDDGEWHTIEVVMDASTGGQPNGRLRLWVDDVLQFDARNVRLASTGDARLHGVAIAPVWGGLEGVKPRTEWLELDWLRVSGR